MQVEVGNIVDGKVTGITNFGAFVEISDGKTGMVHISEVSNSYVKEIGDFICQGQEVKVKVLSVAGDGKISLSMKQCMPEGAEPEQRPRPQARTEEEPRPQQRRRTGAPKNMGWQPKRPEAIDDLSFEDMMTRFKQVSNDRMSDLKKASEPKKSRRSSAK